MGKPEKTSEARTQARWAIWASIIREVKPRACAKLPLRAAASPHCGLFACLE